MRRNFHQSVRDCYVGEDGGKPVGIAAVGKVGRHEARVCGVVGAGAGADIEGELNLAALVEALADFMLEVTAGGGKRPRKGKKISKEKTDRDQSRDQAEPLLHSSSPPFHSSSPRPFKFLLLLSLPNFYTTTNQLILIIFTNNNLLQYNNFTFSSFCLLTFLL